MFIDAFVPSSVHTLSSYITDAITKEEALAMLKSRAASKAEREQRVRETGYPAYVTSAGWLGYDDEKVKRLTLEALNAGFNHFKVRKTSGMCIGDLLTALIQMKVGANRESDLRRGKIIRSVIDDPKNLPPNTKPRDPATLVGKNAGMENSKHHCLHY